MPNRPSSGRARNELARHDIQAAALDLARGGLGNVSVEAIAARAGVGKQTIYRWWPSKAAIVLDALVEDAAAAVPVPVDGPLERDVASFLRRAFRVIDEPGGAGPLLRALMAAAQDDLDLAAQWRDRFIGPRRAALHTIVDAAEARGEIADPDRELLADIAFGGLWYRLLVGHAPLDDAFAGALARTVALVARAS